MVIIEIGRLNHQTNKIETTRIPAKSQTLDGIFQLIYDAIFRIVGDLDEWNDYVKGEVCDYYDSEFDYCDVPKVDSHEWYCYVEGKVQTLKYHTEKCKRIVNYWEKFLAAEVLSKEE